MIRTSNLLTTPACPLTVSTNEVQDTLRNDRQTLPSQYGKVDHSSHNTKHCHRQVMNRSPAHPQRIGPAEARHRERPGDPRTPGAGRSETSNVLHRLVPPPRYAAPSHHSVEKVRRGQRPQDSGIKTTRPAGRTDPVIVARLTIQATHFTAATVALVAKPKPFRWSAPSAACAHHPIRSWVMFGLRHDVIDDVGHNLVSKKTAIAAPLGRFPLIEIGIVIYRRFLIE